MGNWDILSKFQLENSKIDLRKIEQILLENRGLRTKKQQEEFLNPNLSEITVKSLELSQKSLSKTIKRLKDAIDKKEQVIVYGDYDVDGICASAILWESFSELSANIMPYIPHRVTHGYGLSIKGIEDLLLKFPKTKLIFTVDNGIVANEAVDFANERGIDIVITDHHLPSKILPKAFSIIHTTQICGTGVAYILSQEVKKTFGDKKKDNHLELVALATVADLMPLIGPNRALLKKGLEEIHETERIGLLEIFNEAEIKKEDIGTYEIGHVIAPRLNAMGRLEHAMDSLRLICTANEKRAKELAKKLGLTNKDRQKLTFDTLIHARKAVDGKNIKKLIFISHKTYQEGVIGLVAGRLSEEFYRPSIVISEGKLISKASARSVKNFNIIEFIRQADDFLINAGGHPGAAGFSFETKNLPALQKKLEKLAEKVLDEKILQKKLRIDLNLPLQFISEKTYQAISNFSPFGMGNPQPTFLAKNVSVEHAKVVGMDGKHLKLLIKFGEKPNEVISAIAFGMGDRLESLQKDAKIDVVYTIEENIWNGNKKYELKIRDLII